MGRKKLSTIETVEKELNLARKDLGDIIKTLGWSIESNEDYSFAIVKTKSLLKTYLRFKEKGQKYSELVSNSEGTLERQEIYSFNEDLSEVCKLFEENTCYLNGQGLAGFMETANDYYRQVKKEGSIYGDLQGKKGNEANAQQIKEAVLEIQDASMHPNVCYEIRWD